MPDLAHWQWTAPITIGAAGAPAFQNGVAPQGASPTWARPSFYKETSGFVAIEGDFGLPANLAAGSTLFTLPPGYRPTSRRRFTAWSVINNGAAGVQVNPDGTVQNINAVGAVTDAYQLALRFWLGL